MSSILEELSGQEAWEEFLAYRLKKGRFNWHGFEEADSYVASQAYSSIAGSLLSGEGPGIPEKHLVNKMGTTRKRVVYSYPPESQRALKLIAHLLYRYDGSLPPNCYSFRRGLTAQKAVLRLLRQVGESPIWAYKLDIHDYFNSISIPLLLPILKETLADDEALYRFFEGMLSDDRAVSNGAVVHEPKGVMAGTPTAPFLADLYLTEVDRHFAAAGIPYARYSDDMILFAPTREELQGHIETLKAFLDRYRLQPNPEKERVFSPGEPFDFLGFKCLGRRIDIADSSKRKMKDRIRRRARAIHRWQSMKGIEPEKAMKALINSFNRKFFEIDDPHALTWSRWFFPIINGTGGLKEIDLCMQRNLRYLATGRHNKANYRIRYEKIKALGYKSLVHEYYLFREQRSVA